MSRYKVLPLPTLFRKDLFALAQDGPYIESLKMIPAVFHRNGMYYDRNEDVCWIECEHGAWILGNKRDFKQELDYQANDEYILHDDVIDAFKKLESHNLLSKEQRRLWWRHRDACMLRETCREARRWRIRMLP